MKQKIQAIRDLKVGESAFFRDPQSDEYAWVSVKRETPRSLIIASHQQRDSEPEHADTTSMEDLRELLPTLILP